MRRACSKSESQDARVVAGRLFSPLGPALRIALGTVIALLLLELGSGQGPAPSGRPTDELRAGAQGRGRGQNDANRDRRDRTFVFRTEVPEQEYDIVLGNPTDSSVVASVLSYSPVEGYIEIGARPGEYTVRSERLRFEAGKPREVVLDGLVADARYYYRFRSRAAGESLFDSSREFSFRTRRAPGAEFVFTVQSDSHLDGRTDTQLYEVSLRSAHRARPDFHIDLGDTFMIDQRRADYRDSLKQYIAQRYYFGLIGTDAFVFLVSGNHDGEGRSRGEMGAWAREQRRRYYPTPTDSRDDRSNFYAWEWGDALLVALDPYWMTPRRGARGDHWTRTLGLAQYRWLKETLEASTARFKFVFIHHLVGGMNQAARGGIGAAPLYEWGGHDPDGTFRFEERRPGWSKPIHQLLSDTGVSIVFHGHDHFYAKEDLDGVVYQLVPQPGLDRYGPPREAASLYPAGEVVGGPGHLRVTVGTESALVELVQARRGSSSEGESRIAHSYEVRPRCIGGCQ